VTVAVPRALLTGAIPLDPAVRTLIGVWCGGAPFGLALTGDAHLGEQLFRALRPLADHVVRRADDDPPRAVRTLALCADLADLAPAVGRRCTAVLDVSPPVHGLPVTLLDLAASLPDVPRARPDVPAAPPGVAVVPPGVSAPPPGVPLAPPGGRRQTAGDEHDLWRRVVSCLHAHGVHDGALDVAACAMASGVRAAGWDGDPVALVRRWVAEPRGRVAPVRASSPGTDDAGDEGDGGPETDATGSGAAPAPAEPDATPPGDGGAEGAGAGEGAVVDEASGGGPGLAEAADDAAVGSDRDATAGAAGPEAGGAAHRSDVEDAPEAGADDDASTAAADAVPGDEGAPRAATPPPDLAAGTGRDLPDGTAPAAHAVALAVPALTDPPPIPDPTRGGRRGRRGALRRGTGRGRPGRVVDLDRAGGRIAVLPTLHRAVRRQARSGSAEAFRVERGDLRGRLRAEPTALHTVVVVDGSSSMGRAGAAHARRVADLALAQVYRDRGDLSVVVAAGTRARVAQSRTTRVSRARAVLEAGGDEGGGTPLADAVRLALVELGEAPRERCRLVIVSDGCATVDLSGRADERSAVADLRGQLDEARRRVSRTVLVPLDARGWRPLDRTLEPFRAAGVVVAEPD